MNSTRELEKLKNIKKVLILKLPQRINFFRSYFLLSALAFCLRKIAQTIASIRAKIAQEHIIY